MSEKPREFRRGFLFFISLSAVLCVEEVLEDFGGGDCVLSLFSPGARQIVHIEFFIGGETAQAFVLKVDGDINRSFQFCGEITDFLCLQAFGVIHINRQADDNGFDVFGGNNFRQFSYEIFGAVED